MNDLKYSPMSESNTCIAEPNLKLLPLRKFSKGLVYFSRKRSVETVLKNNIWSDVTCEVPLLLYQMLTNSVVNRYRPFAINNWNNFYYLWTNFICKVIRNFCMINELLIWFKIRIIDNCFDFIGGLIWGKTKPCIKNWRW